MSKLYKIFQSPYSLYKPSYHHFVLHYLLQCEWGKYLVVVNLIQSHYFTSEPFYHVCLLFVKKLAREKQAVALMKTSLLLLTKSPNARKLCSSLYFLSFFCFFCVLVFCLVETTTACFQGLGHPKGLIIWRVFILGWNFNSVRQVEIFTIIWEVPSRYKNFKRISTRQKSKAKVNETESES